MRLFRPASPVDYRLCDQTVTVYHKEGSGVRRTVCPRAFFERKLQRTVDAGGERQENTFLLVIPGEKQQVFVGDKVLRGIGEEVTDWASLIPARVPELVCVKSVAVRYWQGKPVHTEAR